MAVKIAPRLDRNLAPLMRGVRSAGSCALNMCSVAMGRADACFEIGIGGPWDCAAGAVIIEEAGGCVADPSGGKFDVMSRRLLVGASEDLVKSISGVISRSKLSSYEPKPSSALVENGDGI